ncbi:MAG: hypothetical protein ACI9KN_002385 [Gammaproteobacteria bacterium]|jgi:hypothetical protein
MPKYGETVNIWSTQVDNKDYTFRFEHQFWTGRKRYFINDKLVKKISGGVIEAHRFRTSTSFTVNGHEVQFLFQAKTYDAHLSYTLFVKDLGIKTIMNLLIDGKQIAGVEEQASRCAGWVIPVVLAFTLLCIFLLS